MAETPRESKGSPSTMSRITRRDLTDEIWREYDIPGREKPYRIDEPVMLYRREGGTTHRVLDRRGIIHCVPFDGKVVLRWATKAGCDPCKF